MKKYILFCLSLLFVVSCNIIPVISEDEYALRQVFKMTGGAEWTNNDNWCGYRPVSEWYGVSADDGTVVGLDLSFNNLKGSFELYGMKSLSDLNISGNDFSYVRIFDISMDEMVLEEISAKSITINETSSDRTIRHVEVRNSDGIGAFHAYGMEEILISDCTIRSLELSDPGYGKVRIVLENVTLVDHRGGIVITDDIVNGEEEFHEKYGEGYYEPEDPKDPEYEKSEIYERLRRLYEDTGGPDWTDNTNWCTEKPIGEWYGITVDAYGNVTGIDLSSNNLTGDLYIGDFPHLKELNVSHNGLTGLSIRNTLLSEIVLDDCVVGNLEVRDVPLITVSNNIINGFTIHSEYKEDESVYEYESLNIENCVVFGGVNIESPLKTLSIENSLVGSVGGWSEYTAHEIHISQTTVMGNCDPYAEKITLSDSEVSEYLNLRTAEVFLKDCYVGNFDYSNDMGTLTMENVAVRGREDDMYLYEGVISGYHEFRKYENGRERLTSYGNDRFNLRCIIWNNAMRSENSRSLENWFLDKPISEWKGVSVDAEGYVVALDLSGMGLEGEFKVFVMPHLQDLDISGNRFETIRISNVHIESLDLNECVSDELRDLRILGVENITVSGIRHMPTIELGSEEEQTSPCRSLTVSDCVFDGNVMGGYVETLVVSNCGMDRVGGQAVTATVDGCIMSSCDIRSDYLYFRDSETYQWWFANTEKELVLENSTVTFISSGDIGHDATVTLTNATLTNNGVTKTFTLPAMDHDAFRKLLEENGL